MQQKDAAHRQWWRTATVVFGPCLLAGLLMQYNLPLTFGWADGAGWPHAIAAPLLLIGIWLIANAKGEMARFAQPTEPGQPTQIIVSTGVYKRSRNPLYLGLVVSFIGLSVGLGQPWLVVAAAIALLLTSKLLIVPEEQYLEAKFGEEYRHYKKRVRRWL